MILDPDRLPTDLDLLTKTFHNWYDKWNPVIDRWLVIHRTEQEEFAKLLEATPELLRLIINLIKDPNLPDVIRLQFYKTANYVYDENDTLPETELGVVGLLDDCVAMAQALEQLVGKYTILLKNNWSGKGDIFELIEYILAHGSPYLKKPE